MPIPSYNQQNVRIVLASSSPYRGALMTKLGLEFVQVSPNINESRKPHEPAHAMVSRLSAQKADALVTTYPSSIIIASDQCAVTQNQQILGKPLNHAKACEQLALVSGQKVTFLTGLCLLAPHQGPTAPFYKQLIVEPFTVHFRKLNAAQIDDYVTREQPLDCAGSFKAEGLGISLFEKLQGDDPNALVGLPLIKLVTLLENIGVFVLSKNA